MFIRSCHTDRADASRTPSKAQERRGGSCDGISGEKSRNAPARVIPGERMRVELRAKRRSGGAKVVTVSRAINRATVTGECCTFPHEIPL
ncbi:MAG: hypothetical protein UHG68_00230, partial [Clostridia bacterium]|nr:hypothetical protein [Clostridia bacterium]